MTFRQEKSKLNDRGRWRDWIDTYRGELREIGLPPEVYLSREHWLDFLDNGHLHWHPDDSTGFEFLELRRDQMERLSHFLERHPEFCPVRAALLGYLRVRLSDGPDR